MRIKFIFFETNNHAEVLKSYIPFISKKIQAEIEIYSNQNVYNQLKPTLKNYNASWFPISKSSLSSIDQGIVIITSPIFLNDFNINNNLKIIYLIHNNNYHINPFSNLYFGNLKLIKHFWTLIHERKKIKSLLKRADAFGFIQESVKNNFEKNSLYPKLLLTLPTYQQNIRIRTPKSGETINIGILGDADRKRRNYAVIENFIKYWSKFPVNLVFLGNTKKLEKYKNINPLIKIITFEDQLDIDLYYEKLSLLDFCIVPVKKYKYFKGVKERVCYSYYSALLMDIFSSGLPSFVPDYINIDNKFSKYIRHYHHYTDIIKGLEEFYENKWNINKNEFHVHSEKHFNLQWEKSKILILNSLCLNNIEYEQ